jgi:hypothetical protein
VAGVPLMLMLSCDGLWPKPGRESCPAFLTVDADTAGMDVAQLARDHGWGRFPGQLLCPSHMRLMQQRRLDGDGRVMPETTSP